MGTQFGTVYKKSFCLLENSSAILARLFLVEPGPHLERGGCERSERGELFQEQNAKHYKTFYTLNQPDR
jgi:hypothetical protein